MDREELSKKRDELAHKHADQYPVSAPDGLEYKIHKNDFICGFNACADLLMPKIERWKDEYENVCKFANDYEEQRDSLRTQLAQSQAAVAELERSLLFNTSDSSLDEIKMMTQEQVRELLAPKSGEVAGG